MSAISLREVQRQLYGGGRAGPPILPHGDDLEVLQEQRRARKRRRISTKKDEVTSKLTSSTTPSMISLLATAGETTATATSHASSIIGRQEEQDLDQLFPASDIPEGFPPDLAFRALAAWATIRTLSLKLRFSPFTPVVFLRALHLPVPTRLLGHIHVALLRLLIPHLQQHYHWGSAISSHHGSNLRRFPWLPHVKKRKLDRLQWTLRAGDDLEYMDLFTWPIFLDDYAHLTADQLYWSATGPPLDELNRNVDDPKDNPEVWKNLDVSLVPDDWVDPTEDRRGRRNPHVPSLSVLYLNDHVAGGGDSEEDDVVIKDDDEEFDLAAAVAEEVVEVAPRKRKRAGTRKSDTTILTHKTRTPKQTISRPSEQEYISTQSVSTVPEVSVSVTHHTSDRHQEVVVQPAAATTTPNPTIVPLSVTTNEVAQSPPQSHHQSLAAVPPRGKPIKSSTVEPQSQNNAMQQMFSNYWKQEQLKSQINSVTAGRTSHLSVSSSTQIQNDRGRRNLPPVHVPGVASKASPGQAKPPKTQSPKLSPEAAILREYTYGPNHTENGVVSASKESAQKMVELAGHGNFTETVEPTHSSDKVHADPPFVWAHFSALEELRSGKAYHQLSVEQKLSILEYLIDEVMMLDIVANEMTFRFTSKEHLDHPYDVLPTEKELDELENDDQCAVCLGEGDLLCCDGCPSSYHHICIGMPISETLPEGKWYCPECVFVDPAKFGPLREAPKSSVDWFRVSDLSRLEEPVLSLTEVAECSMSSEEDQYMVVHGFVFCRSNCSESPLDLEKSLVAPKPLSKSGLFNFLTKFGVEDRGRWPLAQIPASNFTYLACPSYLDDASTFDPNVVANKYRLVPPLLAPKRLSATLLKSVEDQCSPLGTLHVSELLSKSMRSDAMLILEQKSLNPPFSEVLLASNFARDVHQKLLKSLLFRLSHYVWASESFLSLLSKASSIDSVCKEIVCLVDAAHPRAFQSEWFESPSNKSSSATEDREKPTRTSLIQDTNVSSEKSKRHWQCMLPGNVICDLAKTQTSFDAWIRRVKPELATLTVQKNRRKRENKFITQTSITNVVIGDEAKIIQSLGDAKQSVEQTAHEIKEDHEEGYHFRNRHETTQESGAFLEVTASRIQTQIETEQEKLIAFVLNWPKEKWIAEMNWPIAGRRLFEPIGKLPKQEIRRLARRAGSVKSPFVLYSFAYEVGQVSCYHVWRKNMLSCRTFEDMLLGLRTLATFLDADGIRQATTMARKCAKKASPTPDIYCSNTDVSSGEHEYLVLDKSGSSGTWKSSRSIEIKSLIPYQFQRIVAIKLERKAILQKRNQESSQNVKTPAVKTSQSLPVAQVAAPTTPLNSALGWQNGSSFQIFDRHNQEIFRLLLVYANSMGPEFLKARDFLRSETIAKLQKTPGWTRMDMQNIIGYLASGEKYFLERQGRGNPALMRWLQYLYPHNKVVGWHPSPVVNTLGANVTQVPSLAQSTEGKLRRPFKCSVCGEYGHNRLRCPVTLSSGPNMHSIETFPGPAVDSMAVVTARDRQSATNSNRARTSHESTNTIPSCVIPQRMGSDDSRTHTAPRVGRDKNELYSMGANAAQYGTVSVPAVQRQNFSSTHNQGQSGLAMNYQSRSTPSANGIVSSGESYSGKSLSVPGRMNFPPNIDPLVWKQYVASQRMFVNQRGNPSSTVSPEHRRLEFAQNSSRMNMAPDSGRNQQLSTLTDVQSGRTASNGGWNSQPSSGARASSDFVQGPSDGVGLQSTPPYLYSQNGQANTDPLQYLPQQARSDQLAGRPSKWNSAPEGGSGLHYTAQQRNHPQMISQKPQFPNSSGVEAPQSVNWSHGGNQPQLRQVSQFSTGTLMKQANFTTSAGVNSYDSLLTTQASSPATTHFEQYQQHAPPLPPVHRMTTHMSQQEFLGDFEPTPLRTSPQHRAVQGSANKTSQYSANDFMFDQDFLSPRPIHPDHQLNHSQCQEQTEVRQNHSSQHAHNQIPFQGSDQGGRERFPPSA